MITNHKHNNKIPQIFSNQNKTDSYYPKYRSLMI